MPFFESKAKKRARLASQMRIGTPQLQTDPLTGLQKQVGNRAFGMLKNGGMGGINPLYEQPKDAPDPNSAKGAINLLQPHMPQLQAMGAKKALCTKIDKNIGGDYGLVLAREKLKRAVLESAQTADQLDPQVTRVFTLAAKKKEAGVKKLSDSLLKGAKTGPMSIYELYYLANNAVAVGANDVEDPRDFKSEKKEQETLMKAAYDVTSIDAQSLDIGRAQQLDAAREEQIANFEGMGRGQPEVAVLGGGPVGLIAALEAHLAGARVSVYEMRRSGPERENVLALNERTKAKLRRLGVYGDLFGPEHTKAGKLSGGVSVSWLENVLRARCAQIGIPVTYGWGIDKVDDTDKETGKSKITLKRYVPTRAGPEQVIEEATRKRDEGRTTIEATVDLVIGATGGGNAGGKALGIEKETKKDKEGEALADYMLVGIFDPDFKDVAPKGFDVERKVQLFGFRTPVVDYMLYNLTKPEFENFAKDEKSRNEFAADRGKNVAGYGGALKKSAVFPISITQAVEFFNVDKNGIVIGDEAATPHPFSGSGFNSGLATTLGVGDLVRGIGGSKNGKDRDAAFKKYGANAKGMTDKMVAKAMKIFEKKGK